MSKYTIEDCKITAKERNGECLSTSYKDNKTKLKWKCSKGHIWEACYKSIKHRTSWCIKCRPKPKSTKTIEDIKKIIESKGGTCKSTVYENAKTPIEMICDKGHNVTTNYNALRADQWCKQCALINMKNGTQRKKYRNTIWDAIYLSIERGELCISETYKNSILPLKWICKEGHFYEMSYVMYLRSTTCPDCRKAKPLSLEDCNEFAKNKNGKCLSKEYTSSNTKMEWECKEGHNWFATFGSLKSRDSWCYKCAVAKRTNTIENAQKLAEKYNGKCLSIEYTTSKGKLKWQCEKGHVWEARYTNIQGGNWCGECHKSWGEVLIGKYLNNKSIKNKNGKMFDDCYGDVNKLVFDYYLPDNNLCIEYDGEQHFEHTGFFGKEDVFERQQRYDKIKTAYCYNNNIYLLRISYKEKKNIEKLIDKTLEKIDKYDEYKIYLTNKELYKSIYDEYDNKKIYLL